MDYLALKYVHVASVILSYALFLFRGIWMLQVSTVLQQRWVKILPHVNDTILLSSAITLAILTHRNPVDEPWLAAKITGLIIYIVLGMMAFRFGKTQQVRLVNWVLAQIVFLYIVLVALTKHPAIGLI
ncbi:MAG: SirB2 family protein [Nitrosomonas sp.]|nr:SirB2 family protein [Nitrosomonas sp.]